MPAADVLLPPVSKAEVQAMLAAAVSRVVYTSSAADAVVTGANTRLPMLPPDARTGNASWIIPAGAMPIGARCILTGVGTIGARLTTPPGFNLVPWVTPAGGSKTDLPGFSNAPLLGTDGDCTIWLEITQLSGVIRTAGVVNYGQRNDKFYDIGVNLGATGAAGALPTTVASDPSVARTFGVDGFWGTGADTREYVKCRSITVVLNPVS